MISYFLTAHMTNTDATKNNTYGTKNNTENNTDTKLYVPKIKTGTVLNVCP